MNRDRVRVLQSKQPQHKSAVSVIEMAPIYRRHSRTHSYRLMNSPSNVIVHRHGPHTLPTVVATHSSSILRKKKMKSNKKRKSLANYFNYLNEITQAYLIWPSLVLRIQFHVAMDTIANPMDLTMDSNKLTN